MRIGFDAKRAFLNNTGLGNYSRDTIRILSNFHANNKYFLYTPNNTNNVRLSFISERDNIFIKTPVSLINRTLKSYWRNKNIVNDLIRNKIEVYHGLSNELPYGIEKTSIETIVTIHDLIFMRYPQMFKRIDRNIYYKKTKSACKRANKIIAISEQTKKDIIHFLKIPEYKINVVYQGCNNVFRNIISEKNKKETLTKYKLPKDYLLYVGTIEERKNLLTLLKTLKQLTKQKLVVIGNGKSYKEKCLRFISKNNLNSRVTILNNINLNEMAIIYQCASIMIYPSIFEGFGIPILESLVSKTPVITSKGSCFSETGGPSSEYIDPLSVNEIRNAITKIIDSDEVQNRMIEDGYNYSQNFTDENIAKNLINIYNNL